MFYPPTPRYFVWKQRQVPAVKASGPLCPGAEGVQSRHHRRWNHAACESCWIRQDKKTLPLTFNNSLKDVPCRFQTSNKSCCFLLESERNASQSFPAVSGLFYHAVLSFLPFYHFHDFLGVLFKKKSIFLFADFLMNRVVVCRISNNRLFLAWIFLFGYSRLTGWVLNLVQVMEATDYVTEFKRSLVPVYRYHHVNRSNCGITIFFLIYYFIACLFYWRTFISLDIYQVRADVCCWMF